MEEAIILSLSLDPLEACLIVSYGHVNEAHQDEASEAYTRILDSTPIYICRQHHRDVQTSKDGKKAAPEVELKPLPFHLRYELFYLHRTLSIIVSIKPGGAQLEKLLNVLQKHKGDLGYSIDDIKRISLSVCMHRVSLDEGHKPSR